MAIRPTHKRREFSFALADLINKKSEWLRATAIETKGTVENMAILMKHPEKQKVWVDYMNPDTRHQARIAMLPFEHVTSVLGYCCRQNKHHAERLCG